MQFPCVVLDDDQTYCDLVAGLIKDNKNLFVSGCYTSQGEARQHLEQENVDILFIDMEMPELSGLEFVKSLQSPPLIIFITSHPNYALDSYEVEAIDYLMKPVNEYRFTKAVDKAISRIDLKKKADISDTFLDILRAEQDYFVIRNDAQYIKVKFSDVLYIEAMADFVKIHTGSQVLVALINLKNVENAVPKTVFMRTHRSYIVNVTYVSALSGNTIKVQNKEIPVGDSYKELVLERIVGSRLLKR